MRSYRVKPTSTNIYYDFTCPYCKYVLYKSKPEVEKYKFDICYCGAQIIFNVGDKSPPNSKVGITPPYVDKICPNQSSKVATTPLPQTSPPVISKPIKLTPIENIKKYDNKKYLSLLKNLGMKVGPAKVLIMDLIKMGIDPKDEQSFTKKLLENIK
jgi:hypothetical protein